MSGIEDLKDIAGHTQRIGELFKLHKTLDRRSKQEGTNYFSDFPARVKELLELAGTSDEPNQQVRWRLLFREQEVSITTSFGLMLPPSAQHIEKVKIHLKTGSFRREDEGRLLYFVLNYRGKGQPTQTVNDIWKQFQKLGRPEYEFYHLLLLEDLFQFAEARRPVRTEQIMESVGLPRRPRLRQARGMQGRSITVG